MPIPKAVRPSKRLLLRDVVFEKLRDAIVSGELHPGEVINEVDVERWANASRTPVREAIDRLAAVRLVDVRPQRGTSVAELDPERAAESFAILAELLAVSIGVVASSVTTSQQRAIGSAARRTRDAADLLATDGLLDTIVGVVGNPRLRQAFDELGPHVRRTWIVDPSSAPSLTGLDLAAIGDGVPDRVESALRAWWSSINPFSEVNA